MICVGVCVTCVHTLGANKCKLYVVRCDEAMERLESASFNEWIDSTQ